MTGKGFKDCSFDEFAYGKWKISSLALSCLRRKYDHEST